MKLVLTVLIFLLSSNSLYALELPDMIRCNLDDTAYQLVIVIRNSKLPEGTTAVGLKNGPSVIFKVATQMYKKESNLLNFTEIPSTALSKEVEFNVLTKRATLSNYHNYDLKDNSSFNCQL